MHQITYLVWSGFNVNVFDVHRVITLGILLLPNVCSNKTSTSWCSLLLNHITERSFFLFPSKKYILRKGVIIFKMVVPKKTFLVGVIKTKRMMVRRLKYNCSQTVESATAVSKQQIIIPLYALQSIAYSICSHLCWFNVNDCKRERQI